MTTQFHHINLCAKDPSDLENFYKDVLELSESHAYTGNQKQIKNQGYGGRVAFLTDGQSEMHLSTLDLNVAFAPSSRSTLLSAAISLSGRMTSKALSAV